MDSWKLKGVVALEKLILFISIYSLSNLEVYMSTTEVFAVPAAPVSNVDFIPGSFLFSDLG